MVLNADRPVVGFQFDLYLPDGVAVTTDDEGYEDIFLSTARTTTRKHELTAQQQADGSWRVLCYSNSNYSFEGIFHLATAYIKNPTHIRFIIAFKLFNI